MPQEKGRRGRRRSSTEMRIESSVALEALRAAAAQREQEECAPWSGSEGSETSAELRPLGLADIIQNECLVDMLRSPAVPLLRRVLLLLHELGPRRQGLLGAGIVRQVKEEVVHAFVEGHVSTTEVEVNALLDDDNMDRTLRTLMAVGGDAAARGSEEVD